MKINLDEHTKQNILAYSISGIFIVFICFLLQNFSFFRNILNIFLHAMMPFLIGGAIAFIILPLLKWIENKALNKVNIDIRTKRKIAVTISMFIFLMVIVSFFVVLIPQLASSVQTLAGSMDDYLNSFSQIVDSLLEGVDLDQLFTDVYSSISHIISPIIGSQYGILASVVNYSVSVVQTIFHFFVGLIVAIYLLSDFEKFQNQMHKVIYSIFSTRRAQRIFYVMELSSKMFSNFIYGKAIDSLIIGITTAIIGSFMSFPYSILIAFVVGVTNMLPVFGPFLGAIPCLFILLIINPAKAFEFMIFILILQQIDGNILGPRILGDSLGLPALWVLFSILAGGALFGILGMFLGVPIFSVVYVLIRECVHAKLAKKGLYLTEEKEA